MKNLFFITFFLIIVSVGYSQENSPKYYPSDVPKPFASKFTGEIIVPKGYVFTFESDLSPKTLFELFRKEMMKNDFSFVESILTSKIKDYGGNFRWRKGSKEVELMLGVNDEKKNTSIVITYK